MASARRDHAAPGRSQEPAGGYVGCRPTDRPTAMPWRQLFFRGPDLPVPQWRQWRLEPKAERVRDDLRVCPPQVQGQLAWVQRVWLKTAPRIRRTHWFRSTTGHGARRPVHASAVTGTPLLSPGSEPVARLRCRRRSVYPLVECTHRACLYSIDLAVEKHSDAQAGIGTRQGDSNRADVPRVLSALFLLHPAQEVRLLPGISRRHPRGPGHLHLTQPSPWPPDHILANHGRS